jgi:hypothetical protein
MVSRAPGFPIIPQTSPSVIPTVSNWVRIGFILEVWLRVSASVRISVRIRVRVRGRIRIGVRVRVRVRRARAWRVKMK